MRNKLPNRRDVLAGGLAALSGAAIGHAHAAGMAPRGIGIADFVFGIGADDGKLLALNGWTGNVEHAVQPPIDIASLFVNRTAERIVGVDAGTGRIAIFENPGRDGFTIEPIVHEAKTSPDLFTFAPDGRHAVYADFGGVLTVLDLRKASAVRSFEGYAGVHDIRFSALTGLLTATSLDRPDVRTLDIKTDETNALVTIADPEGRGIDHMSQTLSGRKGIIIQPGIAEAQLLRIDPSGSELLRAIRLDSPPLRAFISSDNRYALLPSTQEPTIDIVDLETLQHVKKLGVPGLITTMQTDPFSSHMVGIAPDAGAIITLNSRSLSVVSTQLAAGGADLVALNEESGIAFVLGQGGAGKPLVTPVRTPNVTPTWTPATIDQSMWTITSTNALAVCH